MKSEPEIEAEHETKFNKLESRRRVLQGVVDSLRSLEAAPFQKLIKEKFDPLPAASVDAQKL